MKPSDWCRLKYDAAIEADDMEAADDYRRMFEMWLGRNM